MAERLNGKSGFSSRRHRGSERRGAVPVAAYSLVERQEQSRADKERLQSLIRERHELMEQASEPIDLGNKELPAYKHKEELIASIEGYKATTVGGETGSGKSTQLPQYLYEAGYDMTIVLVPRKVIANGLTDRIRDEMSSQIQDFVPGEEIGVVHGDRTERHENNKVLIMTPNTFIKMQAELREQFGDKKLAVIADEIHEANLYTEIAVGVASLSVQQHDSWRLVAASATHNAEVLEASFQRLNDGYVPKVEIEGRPHAIEFKEEPDLTPSEAYAVHGNAHEKTMIFTSGKEEISRVIDDTRSALEEHEKGSSGKVVFRVLHGDLTDVELSHVNDPIPEGKRLVIVSSPAGMSGITIPGVTLVLTDGTINRSELDNDGASGLNRRLLSQAGIKQQTGRAGRDVPGGVGILCRPVLSKKDDIKRAEDEESELVFTPFEARAKHEPAEIYNTNLQQIILSVSSLGYDFTELNEYIPHKVDHMPIIKAQEALANIGALDDANKVTDIGRAMNKYMVLPEFSRGLYEATLPGRSLQHKVRAALAAAALDAGGLQNYRATEEQEAARKQIIRHTSKDDMIVQLDLMAKVLERTSENWDGYGFIERHGLNAKRTQRALKASRKIMNVMGIDLRNTVYNPPTPDEEQQLRDDFTSGFIEQVHQESGTRNRSGKRYYKNIHGGKDATERLIDDRSAAKVEPGEYIAGLKRYYFKGRRKDGEPIKHDVIGSVFPVRSEVIGYYAEQNGLVQGKRFVPQMVGGKAVDLVQGMFGSIEVGIPRQQELTRPLSDEAKQLLFEYVVSKPGPAQRALRELVNELAGYVQRIPADVRESLRRSDSPDDLTQGDVEEVILDIVAESSEAHEVEAKIREYIYRNNIGPERYYNDEDRHMMTYELSPSYITVGGRHIPLRYENGQPFVSGMRAGVAAKIKSQIFLEDGREVFYRRKVNAGNEMFISFGSVEV